MDRVPLFILHPVLTVHVMFQLHPNRKFLETLQVVLNDINKMILLKIHIYIKIRLEYRLRDII